MAADISVFLQSLLNIFTRIFNAAFANQNGSEACIAKDKAHKQCKFEIRNMLLGVA